MFKESNMNLDVLNWWDKFDNLFAFLTRHHLPLKLNFLAENQGHYEQLDANLETLSLLPSQIAWISNLKSNSTETGSERSWVLSRIKPLDRNIDSPSESSTFPATRYIYSNDMTFCHLFHHLPVLRMAANAIIAIPQATIDRKIW